MEPKHVHHSYIWLGCVSNVLWITFVLVLALGPGLVGLASEIDLPAALLGTGILVAGGVILVLVITGVTLLLRWLGWKHLTYQCLEETFEIKSGIFFKKSVHIPYERIQGIDQKMGILQRALGLCTVQVDTAAGSENESAELPYLTKADAETLRIDLLTRKARILQQRTMAADAKRNASVAATAGQNDTVANPLDSLDNALESFSGVFSAESIRQQATYQRRLTTKELIMASITNANGAFGSMIVMLLVGIGTLVSSLQSLSGLLGDTVGDAMGAAADTAVTFAANQIAHAMIPMIVTSVVGALLLVWAIVVLASLINFGGFTVRRAGDRVEIEHGLLSRNYHGINVARIQSICIKQGLIRRWLGYCEVSAGKIEGSPNEEKKDTTGKLVLHPFMKVDEVDDFLNSLIPEFPTEFTVGIRPAPVAKRRAIVRNAILCNAGFWCLLITLAVLGIVKAVVGPYPDADDQMALFVIQTICIPLAVLFAFVMVLGIPKALLWHKQSHADFGRKAIRVVNGGFMIQTDLIPRKKVQSFKVHDNPLQRMAKVQTISATSAAGTGRNVALRDLSLSDADAWYSWMQPRS